MFKSKNKTIVTKSNVTSVQKNTALTNPFLKAGFQKSAMTTSPQGGNKFSTTGNAFTDQFASISMYRTPRSFKDIEVDCEKIWALDKRKATMFIFYLRIITRKVSLPDGTVTEIPQKGAGLKHESIMRLMWLHQKSPSTFWKNIGLFVALGSWQDVIKMLQTDLVYHKWEGRILNWDKFGELILSGLANENTSELIKKYLPQIKANSANKTVESEADTLIAKWLCSLLFGTKDLRGSTYKQYRLMKASGTAHTWQALISQRKFNLIDFSKIHGRALNLISKSKFLKNQGLENKYETWITKPDVSEVKYTGFAHELFMDLPGSLSDLSVAQRETINRQFMTLVNKGGIDDLTKLIVVRDTSFSMSSMAYSIKMKSNLLAKAIALYFSEFLTGTFSNSWIEFNSKAVMHQWSGNSVLEKWYNDNAHTNSGTNFQSVIDLFCSIKSSGVSEEDFPTGILCISDGCFNKSEVDKTNVESALNKLRQAGFSENYVNNFIIVLWDIPNTYYGRPSVLFETFNTDVSNVFYFSGFDGSVMSFLSSKIKNAGELFDAAMNQQILNMIKL